ncbi:MAG: FAD-binding protein [Candidatus Thermoplasmatota archaeon]|nr:FAD-binding protein [Candidatus Thermoplasmatota archaeon]
MKTTKVLTFKKKVLENVIDIAEKGTHCGMCRIDFLGTGLCPSGKKHGFLAYWPQGRMELVKHLKDGRIKPTEKLIDIANSCNLCGICDKQCNFVTQLRPEKVASALKEYVNCLDKSEYETVPDDEIIKGLREIVGEEWATNDPIIIASYIRSIIPIDAELNFYIVLPENTEQVSKIIKFANKNNLPFLPRAGGTALSIATPTVLSKAINLDHGIIIDLIRLKKLEIHPENSSAVVGAGITSFELQKAAYKHKLRANVAEAGAHYCANIATTGIITTWGNKYGCFADNFIDLEIVDNEGTIKNHHDIDIPNPYTTDNTFSNISLSPSYIITKATAKLFPVFDDEEAVLVPFDNLKDALDMVLELGKRGIGLSVAVLSYKYLAEFICPTRKIANDFEDICKNYMKLRYVVDVICDKDDKKIVEEMAEYTIDQPFMKTLILGSPKLASLKDSEFMKILSEEENPLKAIFAGPMKKHFEKGLDASPEQMSKVYDKDLQDFFKKIYSKSEMTNVVWLHAFRILPSRLMRQQMTMGPGGAVWASDKKHILKWVDMFADVGNKYKLNHALGFISPFDNGKFVYIEYDYFYDHNNPDIANKISTTLLETTEKSLVLGQIFTLINYLFKGIHRKEHVLYPLPKALSKEEQIMFRDVLHSLLGEFEEW